MKSELTTKVHVLEDIDQLLNSLNTIDMQIQVEVGSYISEVGEQKQKHIQKLKNDIISLQKSYYSQKSSQSLSEKEHSYHLTLSY